MCGLAGIIIKDVKRTKGQMADIRNLAGELLISAEVRGNHATGLAIIDRDGEYLIHKKPLSAKELVATDDFLASTELIENKTGAVIGHTRYATQGSPKVNRNNHPIRAGSVIGAHNRWVANDDELFSKYGLDRFAEVDSEVLFRMINSAETPETFMKDMLKNVSGKVSMVWADVEYPEYVYVFKGNNPLSMVYLKSLKIFVYGSTMEIVEEAMKYAGLKGYKPYGIKKWTVIRINTKTFKMLKTNDVKIKKHITQKSYGYLNRYDSYGYGWNYSSEYGGYWCSNTKTSKKGKKAVSNELGTKKGDCGTVSGYVPRYSYRDKLVKSNDGSQIKLFEFKNKKKGNK